MHGQPLAARGQSPDLCRRDAPYREDERELPDPLLRVFAAQFQCYSGVYRASGVYGCGGHPLGRCARIIMAVEEIKPE